MRNLIRLIFTGIVFSILIHLVNAGPTDVWKVCDKDTVSPTAVSGKYCCVTNVNPETFGWVDNPQLLCVDITPPKFEIQYYIDAGLSTSLGNNPRLSAGTVYMKITVNEPLIDSPTISIDAEGTANDVVGVKTTLVSGNIYSYTRVISHDNAAIGVVLEDISISGTDKTYNKAINANPTNEASNAAYTDTTPPTSSLTSVGGDSISPYVTNDNTPDAVFITNENAWCRITQVDQGYDVISPYWVDACAIGEVTTSHTCTSRKLADGQRNVYVVCKDTAGNVQTSTNNLDISVLIDTTVDTTIDSGPSGTVASKDATFTFSCVGETCTFECKLEKTEKLGTSEFSTCTSPKSYSLLSDGAYTFQVIGTDTLGNKDSSPASRTWTVDTTPPLRTNGQPSGMITTSSTTLSLTTNEPATCKYDLMTKAFSTTGGTSHSQLISGLSPGNYNYYVRCSDVVGNYNTDDFPISFSVCSRSNPTVAITPPQQTTEQAGTTLPYTVAVTNSDQNCGTENFGLSITCQPGFTCTFANQFLSIASGSSASTTLSIKSPTTASTGTYQMPVTAKNNADSTFKDDSKSATYTIVCTYRLSIKQMLNFDTGTKHGDYTGIQYTWTLGFTDASSPSCPATIDYTIPSLSYTPVDCHPRVGFYDSASNPPAGTKLSTPYKFSVSRGGSLNNVFKVFNERNGPNPCTMSFVTQVGGVTVDPSFTVRPGGVSNQPPYISSFDFSGNKSSLNMKWESFYPDDSPFRDMKVKCGLNCDPELTDCSKTAGKGCLPYDASQGTQEVKKNSCDVSSPSFDFTNDKIMCLFYDPSDAKLKSRVDQPFIAIDFDVRATDKITTTVGHPFDLKIDISNTGKLKDSYKIELSGSGTVDISPTTITTPVIDVGQLVSTFSSITSLVNQPDTITLKVTSITSGKVVTKDINVSSGLFALPEFGLTGLLQIIGIAAIVYFLFISKLVKKTKR